MMAAEKPRLRCIGDSATISDGLQNVVANLGTGRDKASHTVYVADNLTSEELVAMYRTSWLAAAICDYPAEDATRKWRNWRAEADQITKIEAEEKRLGLQHKVQEALIAARILGGAALYISAENQDPSQPLKPGDKINSLILLGKDELTPGEIVRDIQSPYYGKPEFYEINSNGPGARIRVHASRFAIFTGRKVPGASVYTSNGVWGDSALQNTLSAIKSADTTVANIASLVFEANVDVMKVQGFADLLAQHQDELILRRARLQAAMKGINGMLMIDAQDDYEKKSATFSGLEALMARFFEWVSGAARIPVTRLFGRAAAALSGSGDGDERVYYDRIADIQSQDIEPAIALLDECIITQALGSRPPEIYYEWAPLRQRTEAESAEMFSKYAAAARALAGTNTGEVIPVDALSDAIVNALTELGVLPGLEAAVDKYGSLAEQSGFVGGEDEIQ
jgi:phage-related protein, HI1409 family